MKFLVSSTIILKAVPKAFSIGKTSTGKAIMSHPDHPAHASFSKKEHSEAHYAHVKAFHSLPPSAPHTTLEHHMKAAEHHKKMFQSVQKSLEKAKRHARHMGHTSSGKPIYANVHAHHKHYSGYSKKDHGDAAHAHEKRIHRLMRSAIFFSKKKHHKMVSVIQGAIKRHAKHGHEHRVAHGSHGHKRRG